MQPRLNSLKGRALGLCRHLRYSPRMRYSSLLPGESAALKAFAPAVRKLLGEDLIDLRLFGSRARGQGNEDSDLDIAVIVKDGVRARRKSVHDLGFDLGLEHHVMLAPCVLEIGQLERMRRGERRFARELDRDGVSL